jgi:hypothetical protein
MASITAGLWISLFIWGAEMTIMSHAEIFSSLSGNFIILYRMVMRQPISEIEIWATLVSFAGATVVNLDHKA